MNISSQKIENRNSLRETKDNQKFIPTGTFESFLPWGYILRSLEMAGIGYWHIAINEDGENKLSVNASFLSMAGLDSEQFPKTFEDFVQTCVHPDDRDSSYNTALMNGSGSEGSYDFKARLFNRRTRSWRWVHSFGEVTEKASDGRPLTIFGCIVDIHEAHQSSLDLAEKEEALRQERQRVDAMIDAAGLIIWDWDLENETIRYGDEVYSIQGLSEAKHFSEPWSEAISLEDQARVLEARRRHLSGETSHYEAELQVRRPSGEIFWAHDKGRVVAWDAKGRPTRMMGATSDITSRKEGAQALLDSRLRLEQVLEVGNMAVWDWDLASGKLTINRNFCRLLGRDLAELENLGEKWLDYVHPEDSDKLRSAVANLAEGRENTSTLEYRLKSNNGEYLWFYSTLKAIGHNGKGLPAHIIGAQVDFSDKKRLEESRAYAMKMVQSQKDEMEKQLVERSQLITSAREKMESLMLSSGVRLDPTQKDLKAEMDDLFSRISLVDGEPTDVSARYMQLAFKYISNEMVWYRAVLDKLPFPVSVFDLNRRWTYLNQPALKALNVQSGQDIIGRDYQSGWKNFIDHRVIYQESAGYRKIFIRRQTENDKYFFCQSSVLNDEAGQAIGFIETMQDITKAYEAQSRLRLMLDATPMSSVVFNQTGQVVDCNLEAVSLCGLSTKKEYLEHFFDCMPPCLPDGSPTATVLLRSVQEAIDQGKSFLNLMYLRDVYGRDIPCEVFLTRVAWGGGFIVLGCFRNLQDIMAAQQKINRERLLLKDILEGCPIAFVMASKGRTVLTNPFAGETLGLEIGDDPKFILVDYDESLEIEENLKKGHSINWRPVKVLRANGEIMEGLLNIHITEYDKQPMWVGWLMDVSELKNKEHELEVARDQAEASTRAKSSFLANMSHEIRTPMNAIIGLSHLLLQTDLSEQQREYVIKSDTASKSLLHLINDILDFSKIEAGKLDLSPGEFSLTDLLSRAVDLFAPQAFSKGLEFILNVYPKLPMYFIGDDFRILQIINNLVSNAIKFTASGSIKLEVSLVSKIMDEAWLKVEIKDSGIGIAPKNAEKLFSAFTQADNSHTRRFGGTGLGLAISKQLVNMMGGKIWCRSVPGRGSSFFFTIRLGLTRKEEIYLEASSAFRGREILLADCQRDALESMSRSLGALGFEVNEAHSGYDAVTIMERRVKSGPPIDLMLIAQDMIGLSGQNTLERIMEITGEEKFPPAALIVGSGVRHEPLKNNSVARAVIQKPFIAPTLADILAGILDLDEKSYNRRHIRSETEQDPVSIVRNLAGSKILLVEDNEVNQLVAKKILEKALFKVTVAENGKRAVELVKSGITFDMVLMDIQMPVMDGLTATEQIRRDDRFKDLPIVAMTAHASGSDRETSLAAGMNDHVNKPLDLGDLFSCMAKWIKPKNKNGGNGRTQVGQGDYENTSTGRSGATGLGVEPDAGSLGPIDKLKQN